MTREGPLRRVLVIDAEPHLPRLISLMLGEEVEVEIATNADSAFEHIHRTPYDAVLLDLELPGVDGFAVLRRLHKLAPDLAIVLLTASASVASAVRAMRLGAFDYLRKTASADELRAVVDRAAAHGNLAREVRRLRSELDRAHGLVDMVAQAAPMRQLMAMVERVAHSDATVLIYGESGTGKELMARTIHRLGPRADKPLVAFDCSALSPTLLEAELFGHEKGAFTGAGKARRGLFREAHSGTIFLDEIGDIAPEIQNKLLRVLQEREIKPVGGDQFIPIDVRVIAATNKDLKAQVTRGVFREDLYWRLAVVPIQVPPLRERREDIPLLAAHCLARRRGAARTRGGQEVHYPTKISAPALARLSAYTWPGNIRELENVLSRAAILCVGDTIRADDLEMAGLVAGGTSEGALAKASGGDAAVGLSRPIETGGRTLPEIIAETVRSVERHAIEAALAEVGGSAAKAAKRLGISRASIYNKLREYGIGT